MRAYYLAAALAIIAQPSAAYAGPYADEMAKCLVSKTNDADKALLTQWIFSAMSASPAVKAMVSMTHEQHDAYNRAGAALFQRMLLGDCRTETIAAMKYEGPTALESSFQVLGGVAMRSLMADPNVEKELSSFGSYFDKEKLQAILKEGGAATPTP